MDSACIIWSGATNRPGGYGKRTVGGRTVYVHRLTWEEAHGPIPPGLCVLHRCDNPPCHNIDHLFLGTHRDNFEDMIAKGRQRVGNLRGEASPRAKLTEAQVREIRQLVRVGDESQGSIARRYRVGPKVINQIGAGTTWCHLWVNEPLLDVR